MAFNESPRMKHLFAFVALTWAATLAPLSAQAQPAAPAATLQQAAERFLDWRATAAVRGAPDAQALPSLQPMLTPTLHCLLQLADGFRSTLAAAHPQDKPPFVGGDLFGSLWEGPSRYRIESVQPQRHTARVVVRLTHEPGGDTKPTVWRDVLHLQRTPLGWRVADVEYQGNWDFANKGRLRAGLVETMSLPNPAAPAVPAAVKACLRL
jgi:hypothetical protein